jgi:hypothetical protein
MWLLVWYSLDVRSATQMSWSRSASPARDAEGRRMSMAAATTMANGCNGDGMAAIVICERALLAPVQLAVLVLLSAYYG